jgi:hypothetical protein
MLFNQELVTSAQIVVASCCFKPHVLAMLWMAAVKTQERRQHRRSCCRHLFVNAIPRSRLSRLMWRFWIQHEGIT